MPSASGPGPDRVRNRREKERARARARAREREGERESAHKRTMQNLSLHLTSISRARRPQYPASPRSMDIQQGCFTQVCMIKVRGKQVKNTLYNVLIRLSRCRGFVKWECALTARRCCRFHNQALGKPCSVVLLLWSCANKHISTPRPGTHTHGTAPSP